MHVFKDQGWKEFGLGRYSFVRIVVIIPLNKAALFYPQQSSPAPKEHLLPHSLLSNSCVNGTNFSKAACFQCTDYSRLELFLISRCFYLEWDTLWVYLIYLRRLSPQVPPEERWCFRRFCFAVCWPVSCLVL